MILNWDSLERSECLTACSRVAESCSGFFGGGAVTEAVAAAAVEAATGSGA